MENIGNMIYYNREIMENKTCLVMGGKENCCLNQKSDIKGIFENSSYSDNESVIKCSHGSCYSYKEDLEKRSNKNGYYFSEGSFANCNYNVNLRDYFRPLPISQVHNYSATDVVKASIEDDQMSTYLVLTDATSDEDVPDNYNRQTDDDDDDDDDDENCEDLVKSSNKNKTKSRGCKYYKKRISDNCIYTHDNTLPNSGRLPMGLREEIPKKVDDVSNSANTKVDYIEDTVASATACDNQNNQSQFSLLNKEPLCHEIMLAESKQLPNNHVEPDNANTERNKDTFERHEIYEEIYSTCHSGHDKSVTDGVKIRFLFLYIRNIIVCKYTQLVYHQLNFNSNFHTRARLRALTHNT